MVGSHPTSTVWNGGGGVLRPLAVAAPGTLHALYAKGIF